MNICFYAGVSGLGNNGGTNTILQSAQALRDRGHRVDVVAAVDRFTRYEHPQVLCNIPRDADAVCAASYLDVKAMHNLTERPKFWWMRLWDSGCDALAALQPTAVNSSWLAGQLGFGVVIPQGVDVDFWLGGLRKSGPVERVGAVVRQEGRKGLKDWLKISNTLAGFEVTTAGNMYPDEIRAWYKTLSYFVAPAYTEGLPNTPIEAALCGAAVVCRAEPSAGCLDFADDSNALLYTDIRDVPKMLRADTTERRAGRVDRLRRAVIDKVGTREKCAERLEAFFSA